MLLRARKAKEKKVDTTYIGRFSLTMQSDWRINVSEVFSENKHLDTIINLIVTEKMPVSLESGFAAMLGS